jgi:hypothetical protein
MDEKNERRENGMDGQKELCASYCEEQWAWKLRAS